MKMVKYPNGRIKQLHECGIIATKFKRKHKRLHYSDAVTGSTFQKS